MVVLPLYKGRSECKERLPNRASPLPLRSHIHRSVWDSFVALQTFIIVLHFSGSKLNTRETYWFFLYTAEHSYRILMKNYEFYNIIENPIIPLAKATSSQKY